MAFFFLLSEDNFPPGVKVIIRKEKNWKWVQFGQVFALVIGLTRTAIPTGQEQNTGDQRVNFDILIIFFFLNENVVCLICVPPRPHLLPSQTQNSDSMLLQAHSYLNDSVIIRDSVIIMMTTSSIKFPFITFCCPSHNSRAQLCSMNLKLL